MTMEAQSLLELPPEIRNKIYELVLVRPQEELVMKGASSPALLRTCGQIREEASSIYYGCNTFVITNAERLCIPWFLSRPVAMRMHIKAVRIYTNCTASGSVAVNYKARLVSRLNTEIMRRGHSFVPEFQVFFRLDSKSRPLWQTTPRNRLMVLR